MVDLENYIREGDTAQNKWQRLLDSVYAGYLTMDVANRYIGIFSQEDEGFGDPKSNKEVDLHPELIEEKHDPNESLPPRRLVLDYEAALKFKPYTMPNIWHHKDRPDNCHGYATPNNNKLYALSILEEYGFIKIGDSLVSRTVQPTIIQGSQSEYIQNTITLFPAAYGELILKKFPCIAAVGGGFSYFGIFEKRESSDLLKEKYECDATTILRCVGRPRIYLQPYPHDLVNHPPQFEETRLYI